MLKSRITLFAGILLIAIYPTIVKLIGGLAVVSAFYRVLIPALCLFPFLFSSSVQIPKGKNLLFTLLCGVLFGLDIYCWNLAIVGSTATQATLLTNLAPIFVGIIAFLFLPNKPRINFWIGATIALMGVMIFIGWQVFIELSFDFPLLLGITSAILYATYIVLSKIALTKTQVLPYMALNIATTSTVLGLVNYTTNQPFTGFTSERWIYLVVGGLICQLLARVLISYSTKFMRIT